jgi:hypothetical protein
VNPAHLFIGTRSDNAKDRTKKGRSKPCRGELNGRAKITNQQAKEIRGLYQERRAKSGRPKTSDIAERYGLSTVTVWEIGTGRKYKFVTQSQLI